MLLQGKQSLAERLPMHGLDPQDIFTDNARRLFGEDIPDSPPCQGGVPRRGEGVQQTDRITRLAEIEVDPSQLEAYMQYATEVGHTSMATEPGVLTLFSMQDKANPAKIYILEVYADNAAYQRHIQTPHFRKYKESTAAMVRNLKLIDVNPLVPLTTKGNAQRQVAP